MQTRWIAANFNWLEKFYHAFNHMNYWHKSLFYWQSSKPAGSCTHAVSISRCLKQYKTLAAHTICQIISCLLLFPALAVAQSQNSDYDLQLGKSLEENLTNGQAVWLNDGQVDFFAVFNPDQSRLSKGGVILLHDAGSNPDSPEVIQPLRADLQEHGWATLSIQLPYLTSVSDYSSKQDVINNRIEAAIKYLNNDGLGNIALIGHGTGAMAATAYLSAQPAATVQSFVAISLAIIEGDSKSESTIAQIEKISLPFLDIYGSDDFDNVINSARSRAFAARIYSNSAMQTRETEQNKRSAFANNAAQSSQSYIFYRQAQIEGASHDFSAAPYLLTQRITGWLELHAKGAALSQR